MYLLQSVLSFYSYLIYFYLVLIIIRMFLERKVSNQISYYGGPAVIVIRDNLQKPTKTQK